MTALEEVKGVVTRPRGFLAAGVRAGIKEKGEDLALIVSECPASAAGVFTRNIVKAAPVLVDMERLPRATARAIVANSGNANCVTGEQGMKDARRMAVEVSSRLGIEEEDVLVASTGVIGRPLPMEAVAIGIGTAVSTLSSESGDDAARAIMTTDTRPKEFAVELEIGGVKAVIGGIAKGAGMICPNVATMLAFITTDVAISPEMLQAALRKSADISFNCLTVDGDTSTNDTVIILANGMAGNQPVTSPGPDFDTFLEALDCVSTHLAKQMAADGEGATQFVVITVSGAQSSEDARKVAKTIANSPLVKTAIFGRDPNWGRILAAAGRAGVDFDPREVCLDLGPMTLVRNGEPVEFSIAEAQRYLCPPEVSIWLTIGSGLGAATVWTCDFSYDYIKINAEYHT